MPTRPVIAVPLLVSFALAGVLIVAAPRSASGQVPDADEGVRPGDVVTVAFFTAAGQRSDELSGEHIVDRSGQLALPYVGRLNVAGLTTLAIRDTLAARFSQFYASPVIVVRVQIGVNVTGAVRAPGHYAVDPSSTVLDVLARAGGLTDDVGGGFSLPADARNVRLVREAQTHIVDMRPDAITEAISSMRVQSGDWLHVPVAARSRWRDNLQFIASFVNIGATIYLLATR